MYRSAQRSPGPTYSESPGAPPQTSPQAPRVTVVVPCYDEEEAILPTLRQLSRTLEDAGTDYEIIAVDDGSDDLTPHLLREAAGENPRVRVLTHPTNRGYGAALKTGIRNSRSSLIAITDADGTYPNQRLPDLIARCEAGAEMAVGARTGERVEYHWLRKIPKRFLRHWAQWLTRTKIPDINSGLRVFRKEVALRYFNILPDGFSFTLTITLAALRGGCAVDFIPINYSKRVGASKIRPIADTFRFFELVLRTGMYFAPLRLVAPLILVSGLGFLASLSYDLWVLRDLTDKTLLLLFFSLNAALFALLADMIDKRVP